MASLSASQRRTMRAGVIQSFEFTYEISWKMLRRQLKNEEGDDDVTRLSRKDLYRLAAQKGLIDDPGSWFCFQAKGVACLKNKALLPINASY